MVLAAGGAQCPNELPGSASDCGLHHRRRCDVDCWRLLALMVGNEGLPGPECRTDQPAAIVDSLHLVGAITWGAGAACEGHQGHQGGDGKGSVAHGHGKPPGAVVVDVSLMCR